MQDAYYLVAFGDALDAFFRYIGDDEAYRASGLTFFTAETHLNYYREMKAGEPFTIETQLVGLDEKRMHLFHRMLHGKTGELVATNEIMQLHVDQKAGKVAPMRADIFEALSAVWGAHKRLKPPAELGRVMSVPKKDTKPAAKKAVAKKSAARKKPVKKKAKR
jgi:carnitine 3-dehydrogenase